MTMLAPAFAVVFTSIFDFTPARRRRRGRASTRGGQRAVRIAAKPVCSRWGDHVRS